MNKYLIILLLYIFFVSGTGITNDKLLSSDFASITYKRLHWNCVSPHYLPDMLFTDSTYYSLNYPLRQSKWSSYFFSYPYFLSDEIPETPNVANVGKNKGKYIIVLGYDREDNSYHQNVKTIISVCSDSLVIDEDTLGRYIHTYKPVEKLSNDTALIHIMYNELYRLHTPERERCYFNAFPATWEEFQQTFETPGTNMHENATEYISMFGNLKSIRMVDYCHKAVSLLIGARHGTQEAKDLQHTINRRITGRWRNYFNKYKRDKLDPETSRDITIFLNDGIKSKYNIK